MGLDVPFNITWSVLILHIVNVRRKSGRVAEFLVAEATRNSVSFDWLDAI